MARRRDSEVETRSLEDPDEVREFPRGRAAVARFRRGTVSRSTLEPGWVWSRDVGAALGLAWCPTPHFGYVVSGRIAGRQQHGGGEFAYGAGDAFALQAGHDVWVEGDETYVSIDVSQMPQRSAPLAADVLGAIGGTPMVELHRLVSPGMARVLVKLEGSNPTGSMKDRMARASIEAAEADGRLPPGGSVVEYTGGSTGTSLALVCAAKGHPLHIVTSDAFSQEKRDHMAALGARITLVKSDRLQITAQLIKTMIEVARRISVETGAWWVDQFNNPDAAGGYEPLGDEIWEQTGGHVDAFVHSVGTAHSFHGVTTALRRHRPDMTTVAVEPAESPVLSVGRTGAHGIEGIGPGFVVPLWDPADASEFMSVTTHDAEEMARRLAREEALFAGASSGANVVAALRLAERLGPAATVVTLLVDSGLKYLTTDVYRNAEGASLAEALPLMSPAALGISGIT
jgi:cysteine synthase A